SLASASRSNSHPEAGGSSTDAHSTPSRGATCTPPPPLTPPFDLTRKRENPRSQSSSLAWPLSRSKVCQEEPSLASTTVVMTPSLPTTWANLPLRLGKEPVSGPDGSDGSSSRGAPSGSRRSAHPPIRAVRKRTEV